MILCSVGEVIFSSMGAVFQLGSIWHVCFYLGHKHKLLILSRLSDLMTSDLMIRSEHFNIQGEEFIYQLWNTVGR